MRAAGWWLHNPRWLALKVGRWGEGRPLSLSCWLRDLLSVAWDIQQGSVLGPLRLGFLCPSQMQAVAASAGGCANVMPAVQQLAASLSLPGEGWQLAEADVMAAAMTAPRVLAMPVAAVLQRAEEVQVVVKVGD